MARILVVNDTQVILEMFYMLLKEEGYDVVLSSFPTQKVEDVVTLRPDLIILDLIFGHEKSGWQMLQLLKMQRATEHIPVIVCTASTQAVQEIEGFLTAKGVAVVYKPFSVDELLAAIHLALGDKGQDALRQRES